MTMTETNTYKFSESLSSGDDNDQDEYLQKYKYKDKDTHTQTKTNTKCFQEAMYAISIKSRGFKDFSPLHFLHLCCRTSQHILEKPTKSCQRQPLPKNCPDRAWELELAKKAPCNDDRNYNFRTCVNSKMSGEIGCRRKWDFLSDKKLPLCNNISQFR